MISHHTDEHTEAREGDGLTEAQLWVWDWVLDPGSWALGFLLLNIIYSASQTFFLGCEGRSRPWKDTFKTLKIIFRF